MRVRSGMILALGAGLLLGGCAPAATTGGGPVTSPTGREYEPGTRPTRSSFTDAGVLFLAQEQYSRALEQAQQGIAAQPGNPWHYLIAGQANVGLGEYEEALRMYQRAQEIYPAYELEIEPLREQAWAIAFNEGVEAYNAGDLAGAAAAWNRANLIYDQRPEAYLNLAVIHTQEQRFDEAIRAYRGGLEAAGRTPATRQLEPEELEEREETRALMMTNLAQLLMYTEQFAEAERLFREQLARTPDDMELQSNLAAVIARQGRTAEAEEMYDRLLNSPQLSGTDLFAIGVALFQSENYARAAEAFRRYTEIQPNSRDGWYNYANALYAQGSFRELVPVAQRLVQLDPLSENSALILARAHREVGQNQQALQALQANEDHPLRLEELEFRPSPTRTVVSARVTGNRAPQGTPIQLRFTFYGEGGAQLGTETVTVNAPAAGGSTRLEVAHQGLAQAYRYELVR